MTDRQTISRSATRLIKYAAVTLIGLSLTASVLSGCGEKTVLTTKAARQEPVETTPEATPEATKVRVWFVKTKDDQIEYVPVERSVATNSLNDTVAELLKGPTEEEASTGFSSEIPKGTAVIDVKDSKDGIELNLSKQFASDGGGESIETRLEQLRRTVSECEHVKSVYLDVEGNRLSEAGGEGLEVKQPINM